MIKEQKFFELVNYEAILPTRCFLLGYSGEEKAGKASETRGKFGDGLTVRLASDGVRLIVWTGSQTYSDFNFKVDPTFSHECLHMRVSKSQPHASKMRHLAANCTAGRDGLGSAYPRGSAQKRVLQPAWPSPSTSKDTVIQLLGIGDGDFDARRYMFLHPIVRQNPCMQDFIRDGFADVILHAGFAGRIYVKDMLAQVTDGSQGPQYGYNLKMFSVKSRDRQDTLCHQQLQEQSAMAWSKVLQSKDATNLARAKLYDALNDHPDSTEATAMCDSHKSPMSHVWEQLTQEFRTRHGLEGFPVINEDEETWAIISDKLKRKPVLISGKLFRCLAAAQNAKWTCSAKQTWLAIRLKAVHQCTSENPDFEPFQTVVRVLKAAVSQICPLPPLKLVNASELDDVSVLFCPGEIALDLTGFEHVGREELCGVYKECKKISGNGKPVFENAEDPDLHIFWTSRYWVLSDEPLELLHRSNNPCRYASCSEQDWWVKKNCFWEVFSGGIFQSCSVAIQKPGSSAAGPMKKSKLFLNRNAIDRLLSASTGESGKETNASAVSVVRIFNRLFDAVLQDYKDAAKIQVSASEEQTARERLMQEMMLLDRRKFQRHIDRLRGIDRDAARRKRLTAWLLCTESEGSEEETDPEEEEVRRRIQEQIDLGVLKLNQRRSDSLAWVGDTILDASLGVFGVENGLQPRQLDQLRQKLFCAERMGCSARGLGRKRIREAAEFREQQVGKLTMEQKSTLMSTFKKILGSATVPLEHQPQQECSFLTEITQSIHKASSSTDRRDWHDSPARQAAMMADVRAHAAKAHGCASAWCDSSLDGEQTLEDDDKVTEKKSSSERAICDAVLQGRCHHDMNRQCGKSHPCKFFQRGSCKYGSHCRFDHVSCPQSAW